MTVPEPPVFGLLNVNKPSGPTSHDIVARVRRGTHIKKIGHAGTLDPLATGVLVLCLGPATRLAEYVMGSPKTYRARVHFGIETTTYDAEGEVTAQDDTPVTREQVEAALSAFRGDIAQIPPMYSAIQQDGRRLYDLARAGQEVEREPRPVTIERLDLLAWEPPYADLEVVCSPGTYIRSLAYDLGRAVGVGAHLAALERAASGSFTVADAVTWPDLDAAMAAGTWREWLLPPERAVAHLPAVLLDADAVQLVRNGVRIEADGARGLARGLDADGHLVAVLEGRGSAWKPHKVFSV
ncbi:MAG TPA: tRNA pseudouridine(55) synthase TruB [Aggregatilinea sp.]|uniref:tRNA pseudouridine(55) synthase TruB n=1 Tax=Aggregatilinea sp. TaxID=2806333 RepID=UPI002C2EBDC4|nr:tRNA pseudouridine(55) synthase TruB [Aggregatilinea sp.]HML22839.1 tRNA pseudouridine(55) synthase TruB [Aggregatilinea sp.]